ncbi:MAG: hypothetical protein IH628_01900, partial [Proteobacteria bacterium]|nr:hypothetical protein [Pseudomonadota bacterium]
HLSELVAQAKPVNLITKTRRQQKEGAEGGAIEGKSAYCIFNYQENLSLETIQLDGTRTYCVFDSKEKLKEALIRIKEADEGISIVVSGLIDRVREIAAEIGIDPHMVNLSLGIHGRTARLPSADVREFTTMCGHDLVSPNLVRDTIRLVKTGKISEKEGSEMLSEPCLCGIHNPSRSAELLRERAPLYTVDRW